MMAHAPNCGCDRCRRVADEAVTIMPADLEVFAAAWSKWRSTDDGEVRSMRAGGPDAIGSPGSPRWTALQAIAQTRLAAGQATIAAAAPAAPIVPAAAVMRWEVSSLAPTVLVERMTTTDVRTIATFTIAGGAPLASPAGRDAIEACQLAAAAPRLVDALAALTQAVRTPRQLPDGSVSFDLRAPLEEAAAALAAAMDGATLVREVSRG